MINAINISILRNAEYLQFMKNVSSLVQTNDPAVLNVATQLTAFNNAITVLDGLFKTQMANEITAELVLIDERRDKAITGVSTVVLGYTYHFDPAIAQAAALLNDNLKLYGSGVARQNYQAETATIGSIVNDWATKPNLNSAMLALKLELWKSRQ